jgi:hypothetical protein
VTLQHDGNLALVVPPFQKRPDLSLFGLQGPIQLKEEYE